MQIRKPTLVQSSHLLLCALGATVSIALSGCGQSVAAQTIAPVDDGRVVIAAATAAPTVSTQLTATATPIATSTPQAEIEFSGVLGGVGNRTITIDGKTVTIGGAEVHGTLTPGATVKVHAFAAADGSLIAREIELLAAPTPAATQTADDNATHDVNDDQGVDGANHDVNDDQGVDGANHDVNGDQGVDGANHDVNDDHGSDNATHDVNDDHGSDNATHDVNDDHGPNNATHDVNDDHGGNSATHDANDDHGGSSGRGNGGSGHSGDHSGKNDGKGHH